SEGFSAQQCSITSYLSSLQLSGLSIRSPFFSFERSSVAGQPGYGVPPRVTISNRRIPYDH
ncbi:hypothetical protein PMAYCL1PPCAC_22113, partial [Pristionchus mayeri]